MRVEGPTEETTQRHAEVLKLIPENSVYLLLWGTPTGEGDTMMRALGNVTPEGKMQMILAFLAEEIRHDPTGKLAYMLQTALAKQMENLLKDMILQQSMQEKGNVVN